MSVRRVGAAALALGLFWACSGSGTPEVTMGEYTVEAPEEVEAGAVTFNVRNLGAIDHELVILRSTRPADKLPLEENEVQTEARGVEEVGSTDGIDPGEEAGLTVRLGRGRYALICNVPGHYQSGMYTSLRVV